MVEESIILKKFECLHLDGHGPSGAHSTSTSDKI